MKAVEELRGDQEYNEEFFKAGPYNSLLAVLLKSSVDFQKVMFQNAKDHDMLKASACALVPYSRTFGSTNARH